MGMLEDVLGSVLGGQQRGGGMQDSGMQGGLPGGLGGMLGGGQGGMSPIAMALMALLTQQMSGRGGGLGSGGLGDLLGGLTGQAGGMGQIGGSGQIQQLDLNEQASTGSGYAANSGLEGMLQRLEQAGHGHKAQSWVSHGGNESIAPDELQQALGDDTIDQLSTQSGLQKGDLLAQLSEVLPGVIDKLTPQGRLPNRDETANW